MPVAAAAFLAARLSFDPVFRSALFADFLAFDKGPDFLRFFTHSLPLTSSFSLAHFSIMVPAPKERLHGGFSSCLAALNRLRSPCADGGQRPRGTSVRSRGGGVFRQLNMNRAAQVPGERSRSRFLRC
jgi:hypothetical protein